MLETNCVVLQVNCNKATSLSWILAYDLILRLCFNHELYQIELVYNLHSYQITHGRQSK